MLTITIFGANGYAGDAIHTEAARRGYETKPFSRSGRSRESSTFSRILHGDLHDEATVRAIAKQVDVIVVAIPARELDGKRLADAVPSLLSIAAAAKTRVGFVGGSGSLKTSDEGAMLMEDKNFPTAALPEARGQCETLAALRASPVGQWFYVSPALRFGSHAPMPAAGSYLIGGDTVVLNARGESVLSSVDLAKAILDEIAKPAHENVRFSVVSAY